MSSEARKIQSGRGGAGTVTSSRLPSRPPVPDGFKRCSKCSEVKPLTEFSKRSNRKIGVRSDCLICSRRANRGQKRKPKTEAQLELARKANARWRAAHPDKVAAKAREDHLRRKADPERWDRVLTRARRSTMAKYHARRLVVQAAKSELGCTFCSENVAFALDLHHVNPDEKSFSVGGDFTGKAWSRVVAEARKCVVLCANCHRKVHNGMLVLPEDAPRLILPNDAPN